MSGLLGYVFNSALGKNIPVYLTTAGPGFWRPTGAISQVAKDLALEKTKKAFETGKLFNDDDMKSMERLDISNMTHESETDRNAHYSVQGKDASGSEVKDGHVQSDESKQTRSG